MSKARNLANFVSDGSPLSDGTISVSEVSGAAPTASPTFTGNATFDTDTLHVDSTNNRVGVGTTSPNSALETVGGDGITISNSGDTFLQLKTTGTTATNYIEFKDADGSSGAILYNHTNNYLAARVNGSERLRIDSSGNVGIGTSSPAELLNLSSAEPVLRFTDSDDNNYHHLFCSSDDFFISADRNNTGSGNLIFRNGGTAERMRIDSSGNLLVGKTTSSVATVGTRIDSVGGGYFTYNNGMPMQLYRRSSNGAILGLYKDTTSVGSIGIQTGGLTIDGEANHTGLMFAGASILPRDNATNTDGTTDLGTTDGRFKDGYFSGTVNAANFNSTSDATLKTNVETLSGSLDAVKAMRGVSFDWIENGNPEIGVIAQEVEEVLPELVNTNDEGIKSVKYGNIVAVLIEAIKEQQEQINELKAQLNS